MAPKARGFFNRILDAPEDIAAREGDASSRLLRRVAAGGSRTPNARLSIIVPILSPPSNLFVRGFRPKLRPTCPKGTGVFAKQDGRRTLVPYYDAARSRERRPSPARREICWIKNPNDLLVMRDLRFWRGSGAGTFQSPHQLRRP